MLNIFWICLNNFCPYYGTWGRRPMWLACCKDAERDKSPILTNPQCALICCYSHYCVKDMKLLLIQRQESSSNTVFSLPSREKKTWFPARMVGKLREHGCFFGFGSIKLIHQLCHRSWAQDDVAACATWLYKGFPLSPAASLPPKLELKEVQKNCQMEVFILVGEVASKHANYKSDSNNWDMRWWIIVMPCMFQTATCRCFRGEIGSIGTWMTRISNDWTLDSRWRCYQHNPIDSCHIKARQPLMS